MRVERCPSTEGGQPDAPFLGGTGGRNCWDVKPGPAWRLVRAEMKIRLQEALNTLEPLEREILALRHFEQLSLAETATVLGLTESGACRRHLRALKRLKEILSGMPGWLGDLLP